MTLLVSGQAVFNCWKEKRQLLSAWSATDRNFSQITLWLGRQGEIFLNGHPECMLLPSDKAETRGMAAGWTEPCCSHLVSFLCQGSHSMAAFAQREARLSTDPKLGPLLTPAWFWRAGREPLLLHRAGAGGHLLHSQHVLPHQALPFLSFKGDGSHVLLPPKL